MTTDLSQYDEKSMPGADVLNHQRYAIIMADWNSDITSALAQGAVDTFLKHGVSSDNLLVKHVPGTVELTYAAARMMREQSVNAIMVIGCVIQGDTPHFQYVCQSVTEGVTMLNAQGRIPVIFSVLTTLNRQQAVDRAGGKLGNKGVEGAVTAMKMANL